MKTSGKKSKRNFRNDGIFQEVVESLMARHIVIKAPTDVGSIILQL